MNYNVDLALYVASQCWSFGMGQQSPKQQPRLASLTTLHHIKITSNQLQLDQKKWLK